MFEVELHFVESKRFRITRLIELIKSVWTRAAAEVYQMFKSGFGSLLPPTLKLRIQILSRWQDL